jgi:hypothetical protein
MSQLIWWNPNNFLHERAAFCVCYSLGLMWVITDERKSDEPNFINSRLSEAHPRGF